jgi:hypothetical protein
MNVSAPKKVEDFICITENENERMRSLCMNKYLNIFSGADLRLKTDKYNLHLAIPTNCVYYQNVCVGLFFR